MNKYRELIEELEEHAEYCTDENFHSAAALCYDVAAALKREDSDEAIVRKIVREVLTADIL